MRRALLITALAAGTVAVAPAMAQQLRSGEAAPGREETVPLQLTGGQVTQMQQVLNERGFSAGRTDGLWGPDTSAAVTRFQEKNGLHPSGQLDQETLRALGIANAAPAAMLVQNTATPVPGNPPGTNMTGNNPGANAPDGTAGNPPGTAVSRAVDRVQGQTPQSAGTPGNPPGTALGRATDRTLGTNTTGANPGGAAGSGQAAAGGNTNQAVATTNANAPQPAKGANSFTDGEARRRFEGQGYANVSDLKKDGDGVWRGRATKNGAKVGVWLDYKGNIGQN